MLQENDKFTSISDDASFNREALRLFQEQHQRNEPYRHYCESLTIRSLDITSWRDIPALPTDVFKNTIFPICTTSAEQAVETFLTSGTTKEIRGIHRFAEIQTYEHSILRCWKELNLPNCENIYFLSQKKTDAPNSSLIHMFETMRRSNNLDDDRWLITSDGKIDLAKLEHLAQKPVGICGTALAFLHLMEQRDFCPLPKGSWLLETGGYKGTRITLQKPDFYKKLSTFFNIEIGSIINEYSMTELSSQFYTNGLDKIHRGPSWTRVRVINPETNEDVHEGEMGYLTIYDLANTQSILAIRTQDIAIKTNDEQSFFLVGRDPSAIARGCSRANDELLSHNA